MFAVVFIPNFSLQAVLRHEPGVGQAFQPASSPDFQSGIPPGDWKVARTGRQECLPYGGETPALPGKFALVDPGLPKPSIIQLTPAARAHGVAKGLTASQAMARCGDLIIRTRSLAQEEAATEVLLQTAHAFSPNIEATAPGVCTMELKGLGFQLKNGGAESWTAKILQVLEQFHLDAQIGLAVTPDLALLAARAACSADRWSAVSQAASLRSIRTISRLAVGDTADQRSALHSLPLAALEPPPELLEILQRWGIQTIGALLALGKDRVAERLGPAAIELFDRVSAASIRPLKLVAPPETFAEQMEFENEIETMEPLLFVLRRFVEQLSRRLELIYLVVAEFHLRLGLASGGNHERTFKIPAPTGSIETLFRMLHTHLETVRTDSPIVSLRLSARPCHAATHQFGLFETTLRDPNQFAETLARLTALCGPDRVGTPELEATHRPDAFKVGQTFLSASSPDLQVRCSNGRLKSRPHWQTGMSALPLRRFRPAISAHIEFREQRPVLLRSPVFNGAIAEARGPFLSSGNWWEPGRWAREEWDVQTADGALYRIFRSHEGCFVEGVYD